MMTTRTDWNCAAWIVAAFVCALVQATTQDAVAALQVEFELSIVESACPNPGPATLVASGGSGGRVVFLYSIHGVGDTVVPDGLVCAGTEIGLEPKVFFAGLATGNPATLHLPYVPFNACGNVAMQALDLGTCAPSNVVILE